MKYNLYGLTVDITEGQENFNNIVIKVQEYIDKLEAEFEKNLYEKYDNIEQLVDSVEQFCLSYVTDVINLGIKILNENEVYTYDFERFVKNYYISGTYKITEVVEDIKQRYFEIVNSNSIGSSFKKGEMYKDKEMVESLKNAIKTSMEECAYSIAKALKENSNLQIDIQREIDKIESSAMMNNILSGNVEKDKILHVCMSAIEKHPYNENVYNYLIENYKDPNSELENLANHFKINSVTEYKKLRIVEKLSTLDYLSENFQEEREKFHHWAKEYGINIEKIDNQFDKVENIVIENRKIVDGEKYDTLQEANEARINLYSLLEDVNGKDPNNRDKVNEYIEKFENSSIKSKDKYISYFNQILEEENIRYCTVKAKLYPTRQEAKIAREEAQKFDSRVNKFYYEEESLKNLIQDIDDEVTSDLKQMYLERVKISIALIEKQLKIKDKLINYKFDNRMDFSKFYHKNSLIYDISKRFKIMDPGYESLFKKLEQDFFTINNQVYLDPLKANKKFFEFIDHGKLYHKYITDKNRQDKSFFSKLKTNVTGIVYKNYKDEYDILTENGTKELPEYTKEEREETIKHTEKYELEKVTIVSEYKNRFINLDEPYEIEVPKEKLTIDYLYIQNPPIEKEEINKIMKEVDSRIEI